MNLHTAVSILLVIFIGCDQPAAITPETLSSASVTPQTTDETIEPTRSPEAPTEGTEFRGKVVKILDGDTIDVLTNDMTTIRVRLNGIDAPEMGQPFGRTAKEFLSNSIGGSVVRVVSFGQDRYGRTIGEVFSTERYIDAIQPGQLFTEPEERRDLSGLSVTNCDLCGRRLADA